MPGFDNQVMWCANMDFSDPTGAAFDHPGRFTAAGDLAIGTGNLSPSPEIAVGHITGSGGIVISYSSPNINIDGSGAGAGIVWNSIAANQTLAVQNGYFCTGGGTLSLLLPPVSVLGDTIFIYLDGSGAFSVTQGAGQTIKFGNQVTTAGVAGSVTSTGQGDGIMLVCRTPNLRWVITDCMGNLIFV